MTIAEKRASEKQVVELMIKSYCKHTHHEKQLCASCQDLLLYAYQRIDCCPFMAAKTFCSSCKVHCYSLEKRSQIREVMKKAAGGCCFIIRFCCLNMASHQEGDKNENILHGFRHNFINFRSNRYRTANLADHTLFAAGSILFH